MNYSGIHHFKHHYVKDKFFKTRVTRTLKLNPIDKIKKFIKEKNQRNLLKQDPPPKKKKFKFKTWISENPASRGTNDNFLKALLKELSGVGEKIWLHCANLFHLFAIKVNWILDCNCYLEVKDYAIAFIFMFFILFLMYLFFLYHIQLVCY